MTLTASAAARQLANASRDMDALEDELDDLTIPEHVRERRFKEMKENASKLNKMQNTSHGQYLEIKEEKEFLDITTKQSSHVICHFFHKDFKTCKIVDSHLEPLCKKYFDTRFFKADVEKCPFLVSRLQLKVLPVIVCLIDGIVKDKLVGFDDLGMTADFSTETLERRLMKAGALRLSLGFEAQSSGIANSRHRKEAGASSDEDDSGDSDDDGGYNKRMTIRTAKNKSYNSDDEDWSD